MNRAGVIVDVAHSGWETATPTRRGLGEAHGRQPHHLRDRLTSISGAKPDATIKAICDTGGYVGMCCIPRFLGGPGDLNALLDHLDHKHIKTFGPDHAAIGTDVAYVSRYDKEERLKIQKRPDGIVSRFGASSGRWEHFLAQGRLPDLPPPRKKHRLDQLAILHPGEVMRGHSDDVIRKVLRECDAGSWRRTRCDRSPLGTSLI
ncbi:MAG: membrane dipeptidase [Verrucomicrobiales bacterium]